MTITKKDLIKEVSNILNKTQLETSLFFDTLNNVIKSNLESGNDIVCLGTYKFYVQHRKAMVKQNPQTGDKVNVPAKKIAKCKLGSFFKL